MLLQSSLSTWMFDMIIYGEFCCAPGSILCLDDNRMLDWLKN